MRVDSEFRSLLWSSRSKDKSSLFSEIVCWPSAGSRSSFPSRSVSYDSINHWFLVSGSVGYGFTLRFRVLRNFTLFFLAQDGAIGGPFLPPSRFTGCDMVSARSRSPWLFLFRTFLRSGQSRIRGPLLQAHEHWAASPKSQRNLGFCAFIGNRIRLIGFPFVFFLSLEGTTELLDGILPFS